MRTDAGSEPKKVANANCHVEMEVSGAAMFKNHAGTTGDRRSDLHCAVQAVTHLCTWAGV